MTSHPAHSPKSADHRGDSGRRSDAGQGRFTTRDITGLVLAGDMYAAPYDLLGTALQARPDRVHAISERSCAIC